MRKLFGLPTLIAMFSMISWAVPCSAQDRDKGPVKPTSATDQDVKIHNTRKIFRFHRKFKAQERSTESKVSTKSKRYAVQARSTERVGKSPGRTGPNKTLGNQARVYRKHGNGAAKNAERTRKVHRRQLLQ